MGELGSVLLGVVGVLILIGAFGGGGWVLFQHARRTGSRPLTFLGGAMIAIAVYAVVAGVVAAFQMISG